MADIWTSKLGNKFPRAEIDSLDSEHHRILKALRKQPANAVCAECEQPDTCWASVSLGVFVCVQCADVHRAVGTHISKVKGCSGTYLWGPDEISRMQQLGNAEVRSQLGSLADECKPKAGASKDERVEQCRRKYEGACLRVESRKLASPVPQDQLAKAPRPAASLSVPAPASVALPKARQAPEFPLDDLFKDFGEEPALAPQGLFPADARADVRPLVRAQQPGQVSQASSLPSGSQLPPTSFDDFFGDGGNSVPVMEPPSRSEKAASHTTTPDASTAASEDEYFAFLDQCSTPMPQTLSATSKDALASCGQPTIPQPAEWSKIWDDFGEW